ncbi:dTMP kinase [Streptomyces antnestii]|uniref:dTMP kinase n=1 Tax=Streptomyces antnestii TaxID=2494256 RepID=A0A437NX80_9ACTN|nr:dTMP kinase [Streptomyces sp. San01]RVU14595.1 dTMP kinase [Streptomyces sp. San01]
MPTIPLPIRSLGAMQRVLLVALLVPVVLIAVVAAVPALVVLPFFSNGTERVIKILAALTAYARTLLITSRPGP